MKAIAPHLRADAIVTDVGSTKADVVAAARAELGAALRALRAGPSDRRARDARRAVVANRACSRASSSSQRPSPRPRTTPRRRVERLWQRLGAASSAWTRSEHDRVFAAVSHLPHLLAFALVRSIAREDDAERKLAKAGAGFRDFTRIAASSPRMWRDVCIANRDALAVELRATARCSTICRPRSMPATATPSKRSSAPRPSAGARTRPGSTPSSAAPPGAHPPSAAHPTPVGLEHRARLPGTLRVRRRRRVR